MKRTLAFIAAIIFLSLNNTILAESVKAPQSSTIVYHILKDASDVTFQATGTPGFLRINGTGAHATGTLTYDATSKKISGTISVELADLKTGIGLRDQHMKEKYLEVEKFPRAQLTLDRAALDLTAKVSHVEVPAKLQLHGVTRDIIAKTDVIDGNTDQPKVTATISLALSDYKIEIPSYAGITVAKDVDIAVSISAKKEVK